MFINTIPILRYSEQKYEVIQNADSSDKTETSNISVYTAAQNYLKYFFQSPHMLWWFVVLCSIKVSDSLSGPIIKPLLVDLGLSFSQIGVYITMLGAIAALAGAGLASLILHYLTRDKALIVFSVFKMISLTGFVWLAHQYENGQTIQVWLIYMINALEDMFAAMLLVVILTLIMQYCRKNHAATDFTFQVSIMAAISGILYTISGILGDYLGYQKYLVIIIFIALILLFPIIMWKKRLNKY